MSCKIYFGIDVSKDSLEYHGPGAYGSLTNAQQEAMIAQQQKQIEALTAGLQKVTAQIEASKPAPQMVFNQR
ncbi:MAG: hypothetical protein DME96_14550 [Verrucomicrobia bacterium]|nr:MAG: hypothetical protein DME96_14550 [Verrucomicrobiota bacterium]